MTTAARFSIRPYAAADARAAAAVWHEAWHDAHAALMPEAVTRHRTPESFACRLPGLASGAFVAEDEAGLVAFAALDGDEIDQFFLARRARGTGLAARLLDRMEAALASRGVAVARIECAAGNVRARRFYERRGFAVTAVEERALWMPDGLAATAPLARLAKRLGP